jgi:hypothetical protein
MENKIWYDDIAHFMTYDNYYVVLPTQDMSIEAKLNAILRFFLYLGVFLALVRNDYRYLFMGIIAAIVTLILDMYEKRSKKTADVFLDTRKLAVIDNKVCSKSTVDNPFMNPSISDIVYNPNHPAACDLDNEKIQEVVDDNFNARLFRDVSDLYGKYSSQRQFYTMPVTTIPGDQTSFGEWLYNRGPSCKEGNGAQCGRNRGETSVLVRGGL